MHPTHTLTSALHDIARHLAARPVPIAWHDHSPLLAHDTVGAIINVLAAYQHPDTDTTIIALLTLPDGAHRRIDPQLVLLCGLAPRAYTQFRGRRIHTAAVTDIITELGALLCEPGIAAHYTSSQRIAERLVQRAANRHQRRFAAETRTLERAAPTLWHLLDTTADTVDVAATATDRVALQRFCGAVNLSVNHGATSHAQLNEFIDTFVRPAYGIPSQHPNRRPSHRRIRRSLATNIAAQLAA
jgi:hypothetical protein